MKRLKRLFIQFYHFDNFPTHIVEVAVDENLTNDQITNFIYDLAGDFCKVADCSSWSIVNKNGY